MKAHLYISAALLATAAPRHEAPHRPEQDLDFRARVDSFVSQRIASDEFSGVVLVAKGDKILYERATGIANRETNTAINIDTKLQIASTSKLFTQIAIRQLEQAGRLSLQDTVGKFLPGYPNPIVRQRVTIEQLLKHRSGIGSFWNEKFIAHPEAVRTIDDYLQLFQSDSLLFEPGTSEAYSNGGFVVLGAIIERVSGMRYHDYMREKVFLPAGMTSTSPYDRAKLPDNAAIGYTSQPLGLAPGGDRRLAGPAGPRPGQAPPGAVRAAPDSSSPNAAPRLMIRGPDGRVLSGEEAQAAMARRAAGGGTRRSNTSMQAGVSGPAGDHYSTARDFINLSNALLRHRLLDSARTAAVLARYVSNQDFRANGGGPGVNAEFSIFPSGEVMIVLANYDPPSATTVATFIRSLIGSTSASR